MAGWTIARSGSGREGGGGEVVALTHRDATGYSLRVMTSSGQGRGAGRAPPGVPTRRTAVIIWSVLFASVLVFMVFAAVAGPVLFPLRLGEIGELLALVSLGMAVACLLVSRLLPSRLKPYPLAPPDAGALTRTVVASALNEGAALYAVVAWMLGRSTVALAALAISLVGLLLAFPSAARWHRLGGRSEHASPNRLVR